MGASCACSINPPAPTITNMAYISQNGSDVTVSRGAESYFVCARCGGASAMSSAGRGARNSDAQTSTKSLADPEPQIGGLVDCSMDHVRQRHNRHEPAAGETGRRSPAAKPRRSGNHRTTLPAVVANTRPVAKPDITAAT